MAHNQHATFKKNSQFSCISVACPTLMQNYHTALLFQKRPAVGLPVLYIFQFTGKGTEANKSEGGCKLFMKNLPNRTKTQGNFKTANFYFELRAVLKLSHSLFFFFNHCSYIKLYYLQINFLFCQTENGLLTHTNCPRKTKNKKKQT